MGVAPALYLVYLLSAGDVTHAPSGDLPFLSSAASYVWMLEVGRVGEASAGAKASAFVIY